MAIPDIKLNADQQAARDEVLTSIKARTSHLITGDAGSGKTTLVTNIVAMLLRMKMKVSVTATTHKAVAVLARKLREAGVDGASCLTIHSLLALVPRVRGEKLSFERRKNAPAVDADVVIIDECSMAASDVMGFIRRHLSTCAVIFVGDQGQLPPVGEVESQSFSIKRRSHLSRIERQAEGNPILQAVGIIRASQGRKEMDWSWVKPAKVGQFGVFLPRDADAWMRKAFTSTEFRDDADMFRYLCWTNQRVANVNTKVRRWLYGDDIPFPFMLGEKAMLRAPVVRDRTIILNTNEEVSVLDIQPDVYVHPIGRSFAFDAWDAVVPTWKAKVMADDGLEHEIHLVRGDAEYEEAGNRIIVEAAEDRERWEDHHAFRGAFAKAQPIYAMTVHNSQGSTLRHCFLDVPDIRKRVAGNLLEAQQLFYTGGTRPTNTLNLLGVA